MVSGTEIRYVIRKRLWIKETELIEKNIAVGKKYELLTTSGFHAESVS